ncbi:MAG: Copper/Zinc superoxide dismutase [Betaproteobacteria bacterium]|nr:Copper/Zinc superoxide dismutase [Betaproteobacteria bacterium]
MKLTIRALALVSLLVAGCVSNTGGIGRGAVATAILAPKSGSTTTGTVSFSPRGADAVRVTVDITGLKPNAEHGFHVHERGDCSAPDAMSAGGHFNPMGKKHGGMMGEHHAGDIPNLKSDAEGRVRGSFEVMGMSVEAGPADIIGKALVVHRDRDDYKSQPAGDSGPRIACGVINRL